MSRSLARMALSTRNGFAASDRFPDAPARDPGRCAAPLADAVSVPRRNAVLQVARQAIERNLTRA